jgi:hypothetical protein
MTYDPDRYHHHLDGLDLSDAQKHDLMQAMFSIMESFVDRAFGDAPEQRLVAARTSFRAELDPNGIDCQLEPATAFNSVA